MEDIQLYTDKESKPIAPINRDTVHRICSGQVVLNLAIAMKELVENSIDAGSSIIDVLVKEYGSELLEVADNGSGVEEANFRALTLKHHTSKIRAFEDLATVNTLGFRGEALSSLCALSDVEITTKHRSAEIGTRLKYDYAGNIVKREMIARQQGTTVSLKNLFSTLPVRKKEFDKNLKREYAKMCNLLYAYCLLPAGIKYTCTNVSKGARSTVVATEGHKTLRENIISVFGVKQLVTLIDVPTIEPDEDILKEYGLEVVPGQELPFMCDFLISTVLHGDGRSATDRQFIYLNQRPCDLSKVSKLVNEVYRQFNSKQYPFVYLNITTKTCCVDVNITPDKRRVFLDQEKLLLATIKASLLAAFRNFPSTLKVQNLDLNVSRGIKRHFTDETSGHKTILETFKKRHKSDETNNTTQHTERSILDMFKKSLRTEQSQFGHISKTELGSSQDEADKQLNSLVNIACKLTKHDNDDNEHLIDSNDKGTQQSKLEYVSKADLSISQIEAEEKLQTLVNIACDLVGDDDDEEADTQYKTNENSSPVNITIDAFDHTNAHRKEIPLSLTFQQLKEKFNKNSTNNLSTSTSSQVKFRSNIAPESNKLAEEELNRHISKTDFAQMEIIGQFNLGFIIAKLGNDLFIIDQHATDEQYNFEQLQLNTAIENQKLVTPKLLELTASARSVLTEHEDVFRKSGFTFKREYKDSSEQIFLTSVPISERIVFGKGDIDEMVFMLQEDSSQNATCRPSRIRAMFASRACRKSVMIGKALSRMDMRKLVDHMGEIERPWNCPHGRPTMRHLVNLKLLMDDMQL